MLRRRRPPPRSRPGRRLRGQRAEPRRSEISGPEGLPARRLVKWETARERQASARSGTGVAGGVGEEKGSFREEEVFFPLSFPFPFPLSSPFPAVARWSSESAVAGGEQRRRRQQRDQGLQGAGPLPCACWQSRRAGAGREEGGLLRGRRGVGVGSGRSGRSRGRGRRGRSEFRKQHLEERGESSRAAFGRFRRCLLCSSPSLLQQGRGTAGTSMARPALAS